MLCTRYAGRCGCGGVQGDSGYRRPRSDSAATPQHETARDSGRRQGCLPKFRRAAVVLTGDGERVEQGAQSSKSQLLPYGPIILIPNFDLVWPDGESAQPGRVACFGAAEALPSALQGAENSL